MIWKTILSFPKYEINIKGEVRHAETHVVKKLVDNTNSPHYIFYFGHSGRSKVSRSTLLSSAFGIEKPIQNRKNKMVAPVKNCGTCAWQYSGKCSVRNPGTVSSVESDDKCGKWEKIRQEEVENDFSFENYENTFTSQFEGVSMGWEGYALSI